MIFDLAKVRTNTEKSRGSKSHFDFIDESALEEHVKVRVLLNKALEVFSGEARSEIISRIKKNDEEKFHSVCFELLVAFIFKQLDCEIEEHPNIIGSEKHPDFLSEVLHQPKPLAVDTVWFYDTNCSHKVLHRRPADEWYIYGWYSRSFSQSSQTTCNILHK